MRKFIYMSLFTAYDALRGCAFASEAASTPDFISLLVRMLSSLAFILAILFLSLYLLKKFNFRKSNLLGNQRSMEILETLYLGPKRSIALVRVGAECVLVGLTSTQITFLSKIEAPQQTGEEKNQGGHQNMISRANDAEKNQQLFSFSSLQNMDDNAEQGLLKRVLNQIVLTQKAGNVSKRRT